MSGHLPMELLSAHLDGEASPLEARQIAAHLAVCVPCRQRLAGARRLVGGLRRLAPAEVPGAIAARVRERVAAERAGAGGRWARALRSWPLRWFALPPMGRSFSTPLGAALAVLVMVLLAEHGSLPNLATAAGGGVAGRARPAFLVSEAFGDAPAVLPQTTSEVAGRVFVLSDDVWVQRGLDDGDARQPRAVLARSPQGRAMLAQLSGVAMLLADGSRVVLRYNLETLELRDGS